jgi:hypothetical protein
VKLDEDQKNTLKLARAFEPMLRSEGWHYYSQLVLAHKEQHANAVMAATKDISGVLAGERDKGAYVALNFALNLPKVLAEEAAQIRKNMGEDPDGD